MYPTLQNSCHCLHLAFTSLQALLTAFEVTNCLAKGGGVSNSRSHYDDQLLKQTATRINGGGSEVMAVSLSQPHHDIHSFIHSFYFYSAPSSPLLLRGAPDTARILCRNFTPKRHRQLKAKDLPKVPTWQLERESNP